MFKREKKYAGLSSGTKPFEFFPHSWHLASRDYKTNGHHAIPHDKRSLPIVGNSCNTESLPTENMAWNISVPLLILLKLQ